MVLTVFISKKINLIAECVKYPHACHQDKQDDERKHQVSFCVHNYILNYINKPQDCGLFIIRKKLVPIFGIIENITPSSLACRMN